MSFTQITPKNNLIPYVQTQQFGSGVIEYYLQTTVWAVPLNVSAVRVRIFGTGAGNGGGGGGFCMGIAPVSAGTNVTITVAQPTTGNAGTSSFGSFFSATGATTSAGGTGVGGSVNNTGGVGVANIVGGGVASLFGDRGTSYPLKGGTSGSGQSDGTGTAGLTGQGGAYISTGNAGTFDSNAPSYEILHIDHIGTGGGGGYHKGNGFNGGGGGYFGLGGFPGGGGGDNSYGTGGLIILEY